MTSAPRAGNADNRRLNAVMTSRVRCLFLGSELFSDATIAVSAIVRERLVRWGVPDRKITVIPNGLDADGLSFRHADRVQARRQLGIPPTTYVIGTLGRLDENKRVDLTIAAAAPLRGRSVQGPGRRTW
jgi:glycosyltransferase involved in cell wall biosynthesis